MYDSIKKIFRPKIKAFRFNLSANNNPIFIGFYQYFYQPKQNSLSEFLDQYSRSKKGNLEVVQIGANDGITHDPIHKFIKRDRWKGVLLEPQHYVYKNFLSKIYKKNKDIHTICAAIGEKDGSQDLYKIGFSDMRWATGLASFKRSNLEKAFESGLIAERCKRYQVDIPELESERIKAEAVEVISPFTLLKKYNISNIDLLQIDTEGFDYQVIRIFEIEKTSPKVIIFENFHLSNNDTIECQKLLDTNNYVCRKYGSNTLAMKRPLGQFEHFFASK